jgi:2-aminobenzoate-CoA ligase
MPVPTAHIDTFARDRLPAAQALPELLFALPQLQFPARLNCATALLDSAVARGDGGRLCVQGAGVRWTYADLLAQANRIAHVLVDDMGLLPGNRVLLRGANSPMLAACWFAVVKAGGIAVGSMPLLRAKELATIIDKAQISHALCDERLREELAAVPSQTLKHVLYFGGELESRAASKVSSFANVQTAADDVCLMAFTSGTTGTPKGTMHFHRDVMAACACWPAHVLRAQPDDVFIGSPPLAFTFGLGGLLLFPMAIGASTVLVEKVSPDALLPAIAQYGATVCFTAPTSYRVMAGLASQHDLRSLRKCVSAGEALPAATRQLWLDSTGINLIDGIGSTEMLHIFISADETQARGGATGFVVLCWTTRASPCHRAKWAAWLSRGPRAASIWTTCVKRCMCKTAGTSPGTRT